MGESSQKAAIGSLRHMLLRSLACCKVKIWSDSWETWVVPMSDCPVHLNAHLNFCTYQCIHLKEKSKRLKYRAFSWGSQ